jgi:hypothetical protein
MEHSWVMCIWHSNFSISHDQFTCYIKYHLINIGDIVTMFNIGVYDIDISCDQPNDLINLSLPKWKCNSNPLHGWNKSSQFSLGLIMLGSQLEAVSSLIHRLFSSLQIVAHDKFPMWSLLSITDSLSPIVQSITNYRENLINMVATIGQEFINYIMYVVFFQHLCTSLVPFCSFLLVGWLNGNKTTKTIIY